MLAGSRSDYCSKACADVHRPRNDTGLAPQPDGGVDELVRAVTPSIILGSSPAFAETLAAVDRVASASAPVLLVGETGTGKDLLAERIHATSARRQRPYLVVNAAAIPATLLDSELFGHVAGAFTGATRARRGLVLEADGGTLFLDEIADLAIELQGRLLRLLESHVIRPVGADQERPVDVRIIAATHHDLSSAVRAGTFREDLYFRLDVLAIHIPPLRDRGGDGEMLLDYFFDRAKTRNPRSPVRALSPAARAMLLAYRWPGNVRELQACVERLVVLGRSARIEDIDLASILPPRATSEVRCSPHDLAAESQDFPSLRELTTRYVERVLAHTGGDKVRAATILGVNVSTLYRRQGRR